MSRVQQNKITIQANRNKITSIKNIVSSNRASLYQSRSMIEENRLMILSNYAAAFMGNRQLASHNTNDIADDRREIVAGFEPQSEVQMNYLDAASNQSTLSFLEHRCELNSSMLDISETMAAINADLITVNKKIMDANERIVSFNARQIALNSELLDGASKPSLATVEITQALIEGNSATMDELTANAGDNAERIMDLMQESVENTAAMIDNKMLINSRRDSILVNRGDMFANRERIRT